MGGLRPQASRDFENPSRLRREFTTRAACVTGPHILVKKSLSALLWFGVAALGAFGYWTIATQRQEPVNSGFIVIAALCTYALGYRFYSKWIAARVLALDERRATPCEVHEDGKDFCKTNKWIVFCHHL